MVMIMLEAIVKEPAWKEFSPLVQSSQMFWIFKYALKEEASDLVSLTSWAASRPQRDPKISRDPGIELKSRSRDFGRLNPRIFWNLLYKTKR